MTADFSRLSDAALRDSYAVINDLWLAIGRELGRVLIKLRLGEQRLANVRCYSNSGQTLERLD
jgi:hypothetical protein